jgi:hypothetical protein
LKFIDMCQRLRQDAGIAGTGPTTVVAQTGELARLVSWIATAYTNICAQHTNWRFLRSAFSVNTVTDQEAYLATACTDTEVGALIGSATVGAFGSWAIDSEYPWWIYRLSDGTSTRNYFWNLDHASFRDRYDLRPPNHNKPFEYAIRPRDNAILVGPKPDGVYVLQGEYYRVAPPLAVDGRYPVVPRTVPHGDRSLGQALLRRLRRRRRCLHGCEQRVRPDLFSADAGSATAAQARWSTMLMKRAPQFAPKKNDFIQFDGGLDQETPPVLIPPGFLRQAQNYEGGVNGGYKVVTGYERFDGRAKPSDATYAILNATITGAYAVGNTLTGVTSGATGVIAMVAASTYFVLTKVTGTFVVGENLQITAVTVAVSGGAQITDGAANAKLHAQYRNAAADIYRASITAVPGSGPVRGVWRFGDITYAVRDNVGATAAVLFKSSSSGWTAVTMMEEVAFSNANTSVNEGDTLTQGGVTATVQRIAVQTGTLASGVNTGRLIISGRGGGNFAAGAATSTGGGALTLSGAQTAITLTPGGRYEVDIANFTGSTTTRRVYGASGVQRGFEFDGTVYAPITTGMSPDTPNFVKEHKKQLFFAFGASVQNSGLGFPFTWTPISGASEIAQGDTVTGFMVQPGSAQGGGALAIVSRNKTTVLYGSSSADFILNTFSEEQGALPYSCNGSSTTR